MCTIIWKENEHPIEEVDVPYFGKEKKSTLNFQKGNKCFVFPEDFLRVDT